MLGYQNPWTENLPLSYHRLGDFPGCSRDTLPQILHILAASPRNCSAGRLPKLTSRGLPTITADCKHHPRSACMFGSRILWREISVDSLGSCQHDTAWQSRQSGSCSTTFHIFWPSFFFNICMPKDNGHAVPGIPLTWWVRCFMNGKSREPTVQGIGRKSCSFGLSEEDCKEQRRSKPRC